MKATKGSVNNMNRAKREDNYFVNSYPIYVTNNGGSMPTYLYDDEDNRAFKLKYVRSDGWRGYWETEPVKKWGWEKIDYGWVTDDYDDAYGHGYTDVTNGFKQLARQQCKVGKKLLVVLAPTSNVFSTGYNVYTKKVGK